MGLTKRQALANQQIRDVGRREKLVGRGMLEPLSPEADRAEHPVSGSKRELERVDRIEQVLLVLLEVLVVGQGQSVHHAMKRQEVACDPRRLGTQQLGGVRVLLLGHERGT